MALIRHASYNPDARWDRTLTLTIDKVVRSERYSDGNDEDPSLNPVAKWETLRMPEVVALYPPEGPARVLTTTEFVTYVNEDGNGQDPEDSYRTPWIFYDVGGRPAAVFEHDIP
ncbi:hypothetical protein [Propionicimonas sp.]|uniref:hypothetical protein n=1 Tax=Propionicimonas sp. TaxID=1955623 RepID=UPI0039E34575